jgi:hypothetical protein
VNFSTAQIALSVVLRSSLQSCALHHSGREPT